MNKTTRSIIGLLLLCSSVHAQSAFRAGYIIDQQGDTLRGDLASQTAAKNYESCLLQSTNGTITTYTANDIRAFGIDGGKLFKSGITEDSFVEVLVLGQLSLYKAQERYMVEKKGELYELASSTREGRTAGSANIRDHGEWRGTLASLIGDCFLDASERTANRPLNDGSLAKIVVDYHRCLGADYTDVRSSVPGVRFRIGLALGLNLNTISFSKGTSGFRDHLADSYRTLTPTVGIVASISSARASERFAFQPEVYFQKASYSSMIVNTNLSTTAFHDTFIDLTSLSMLLSGKYMFRERSLGYFLQSGLFLDTHVKASAKTTTILVGGNGVALPPNERSSLDVTRGQLGLFCGLGISKAFRALQTNLSLRYHRALTTLNASQDFNANSSRWSLQLQVLKK